jgi:hypothetical protein
MNSVPTFSLAALGEQRSFRDTARQVNKSALRKLSLWYAWVKGQEAKRVAEEPENIVLHMLREMREQMATKGDLTALEERLERSTDAKINSLRADVASDLLVTRKELSEQIVGLRRAVMEYHSSAVGHGMLISELEERVRRVEQHLNLPPLASH